MQKQLRTFANTIEIFRDLDPEIQAQTVLTFLFVAMAPEQAPPSMQELQRRLVT